MKKEGKRISRHKPNEKWQSIFCLRKMAERGWLLEDMQGSAYTFREEEAQYLRYRIETMEQPPSEAERAAYAKEGWQEVCHDGLEYVFSKEREPYDDTPDAEMEELAKKFDAPIAQLKKDNKISRLLAVGVFMISYGVINTMERNDFEGKTGPPLLTIGIMLLCSVGLSWLKNWLKRKKEQMLDGDIFTEFTDWGGRLTLFAVALLIGLGIWYWVH